MLTIIALVIPLSGCKFKDLDLRLFVVAMGVDKVEGSPTRVSVTVKAAVPLGDPKQAEEKILILTEESDTIGEAIRIMKSRTDKELDFGHCKVMLYGESYARQGILQTSDWMLRRRDIQLLIYNAVARPTAKEVLKVQPVTERLPGNSLLLALSMDGTESPYIVPPMFSYRLERTLMERGSDPIMSIVEARGKDQLEIDKSYLFNKERAVEELNPSETRIYNLLNNKNLKTSLEAKVNGTNFSYMIERSQASYNLKRSKDEASSLNYHLKIRGVMEENEEGAVVTEQELHKVSQAAGEQLDEQVEKVLNKIHKSKTDPLCWGLRYTAHHWNNETEWQQWQEIEKTLTFKVHSDVRIKYTGMIR
ncbi:Ger(x)C family spore germination protein [Paenibacillus sp. JX-17]|uniref:Ger(X)C family spore germination protein n=1 Tax=Paenibacillus lacisoli TaxID=3064525 RepID=A0ABT9C9X3_9BACL|nr:Ger(x)C family spore germination protein [Paenibacillus sp. JX-17]MDO7906060.1 Ger(x)C family spore germination protein [Paenibacillus sp. JX-17]